MEANLFHLSPDHQPISPPHKSHIKNNTYPKRRSTTNHPPFISSQNSHNFFAPISLNLHNSSLSQGPSQYLSNSYPPFSFDYPPRAGDLSCPPTYRKPTNNNTIKPRHSSLTPKRSKTISNKEENLKHSGLQEESKDRPKNVPKILTLLPGHISSNNVIGTNDVSSFDAMKEQVDGFSGSVAFSTLSPPPSSLPLPTFSLRPKLSCNAEAAGIDAGATNNLRRLLRLP